MDHQSSLGEHLLQRRVRGDLRGLSCLIERDLQIPLKRSFLREVGMAEYPIGLLV